jgi:phosphatidylinositol alpha-1,6-mannosyltransferase
LGFKLSDELIPGGLATAARCIVRALASSPTIEKLGIWCQLEQPGTDDFIRQMVQVYAHRSLDLEVRIFAGSRARLAAAVAGASWRRHYDHIMYVLVNQATLALLPGHLPYTVWKIGVELFQPVSRWKKRVLRQADGLLSISYNTTRLAVRNNPGLPSGQVVHLCYEPPLYAPEPECGSGLEQPYQPNKREQVVMMVASMYRWGQFGKGHRELIAAWSQVVEICSKVELWLVGDGDGRLELENQAHTLPASVARQIKFLGRIDKATLQDCYRRCRVFAMPSTVEGFGLVFVEAAQYGIPCIGGKRDSAPEIILANETGLLVEQQPRDIARACLQLLTDDNLAQRLGRAARQRYLNYFQFQHFRKRLLQALGLEQ